MNAIKKVKNIFLTGLYTAFIYCAYRVRVEYEDPAQKDNPPQGIYISNHMGHLDGILIRSIFRKKIRMYSLVTTEWTDKAWARELLFYEDCISVDRDNPGTGWIHEAKQAIKEGSSVNIFPEGHTSKSENMDMFKPGFLMLAAMLKDIPVIPVATCGSTIPFFGKRKKVLIGRPVAVDRKKIRDEEGLIAESARFRKMIADMKLKLDPDIVFDKEQQ